LFDGQGNPIGADIWDNGAITFGVGVPVPEPSSLTLFGIGAVGLLARRRRVA